ncbi:ribonucleoside-diphosphate reductase, adenosylcobalamin-dependent [Candidatus Desantisbacteria bacterium CG_4_10_14_0_8_um_filter_48_22]|uniref:Vitamin B12-dependent ribonucleotide reductase n=1 Tax=Candidatus Desantisbacteria bacterium CG_4_10_14_0_8_um_filter_48_22 TaxID=1974543 RepID=A0A2M7SE52_9BACT|nr:MAG: ribonucleoside-diphosphate reductase, adenosylcobalamin-dependent [Candidatus Desantisbacteria bacterium CG1_02_49_89]PIV55081.1 MAG: ribonucleoside-diphosphate reductase, adenosylcobalamin-dependent [Candidatus Desantisbacteria bacterium CG02_land_8_20_14_3_00_49_13]PIZ17583.1 MAG: ribonucleoside-diphosphate reductase, adenosylcobalamin-dependent [Candidatus Desantisbacteria bacterium CG_4_10_14_0_8_um_filter_48_22]
MKTEKIYKRDGSIARFEPTKIATAIFKALSSQGRGDARLAKDLTQEAMALCENRFTKKIPTVEDIQDMVEEVLIRHGYPEVAKSYILYRYRRSELREAKQVLGVTDDLKLSVNAIRVLKKRYLARDPRGNVLETPAQMFRRVARAVAEAEKKYSHGERAKIEDEFFRLMANLEFLPNSPTLMNAGTQTGQLSACFVIPVEDSIEGIFRAVKEMAVVHQSGGGTGFSFSRLRPAGDTVQSTGGIASGPVSFMKVFDAATDVVKQGGRRRGANMAVLSVSHPDIIDFITAKDKEHVFDNFNLSVAVTDDFMNAAEKGAVYSLINPRNGRIVRELPARTVLDLIVNMAWRTGDPGLLFIDEINRHNPTPAAGEIEATNPCGEQPLLPYESCNLGSINLSRIVEDGKPNWEKLRKIVHLGVHFLDNVIDVTRFPIPIIEKITRSNRKIGLGVMGFAEVLIKLGIPYNSEEAVSFAGKIIKFIREAARDESQRLAEERGSFPNFPASIWKKKDYRRMRNATLTTVAPTGSISIIAGCSSGIEPLFAVSYARSVMEGMKLLEVDQLFEETANKKGFYSKELMGEIARSGTVKDNQQVPPDVRRLFVTALDIEPEWHVRIQAAFQKYTDNAVSKTVNLSREASPEDVRGIFTAAYALKCKGITAYRYGSRSQQVLYTGLQPNDAGGEYVSADAEYAGGCPGTICPF